MQRLFRKMNGEELEAAFRGIFVQMCEQNKQDRGAWAVAIDGKAQKGRLKFEEENSYPVHAVIIVEHETGIVLTQGHVERGDTLDCQRCLCAANLLAGGDCLYIVKPNQPQLFEDLRLLCAPPDPAKRA